jgi:histone-lysine N-methyltransferase SETMAR
MRLSAGKVLTTIFWDWKGVLLVDFLHEHRTVNAAYHCQLLDNVKAAYKNKRHGQPIRNVILLHNNARPHTAILTRNKLKEFHWETLEYPPYSPDLSPSDYHLFGPLKEALGGHRFQSDNEVEEFVHNWARDTSSNFL